MTIVTGTLVPGSNSNTGTAFSNTSVLALSIDIVPLSINNSNTSPTIGGSNSTCVFPISWSKSALLPSVDLSKLFLVAGNNTDGVAYIYQTLP